MKIALFGYGKMGLLVEQMAQAKGDEIIARFSKTLGTANDQAENLLAADVAIDFSNASCVLPHLELCLKLNIPLVIGTTGWEEQLTYAQERVKEKGGACLYAPNFSIGVFLFQQIVAYAATLFNPFVEYDVSGVEAHHRKKLDHPSGTAKTLTKQLLKKMPRLHDFHFTSIRSGYIPGTHTIQFNGPTDSITLTHEAHNRDGFAQGALLAAEWLITKKGFFSLDDMQFTTTQ